MLASPIELPLAGHIFCFTQMAWRAEVLFSKEFPRATRLDYTAAAMVKVDGKGVTPEQATAILKTLPRPIRDRVIIFYMGSLPTRRVFTVEVPYAAPEPQNYQNRVDEEDAELLSEEDEALNRTFGVEEVLEAKAMALEMAKNTNFAGVTRSLDDPTLPPPPPGEGSIEEEAPRYHVVI